MKGDVDKGSEKPTGNGDIRSAKQFPAPPAIPHHALLRQIGSGSYGDVWLARNAMGTLRAIKFVYRSCFEDRRPFERELSGIRKFEPISRSHEGFVDVLQVGIDDSEAYFFYIMELGDDRLTRQRIDPANYSPKTLASEISARGKLPIQECLELGSALAKAIHQLHKHGLVHRDIKPSNIIFVEGIPKLADIGLVAGVDETRSYVGTEGFIPPEGPGSPQADVFSLGRVLYEASTGRDRHYFPELPGSLKDYPDSERFLELNEVVLRACKAEQSERFQSAEEMQSELLVLLSGKSVRRLRQLERKLAALKRAAFGLLSVSAVGALIALPIYREQQEKLAARQRQIGATIAYGNRSLEAGDFMGALPFFTDALRLHREEHADETADRIRIGSILAQCPKLTHLWTEGSEINDEEFSHDGKRVVMTFESGYARIRDLDDDSVESKRFGQSDYIENAAFSHDDRLVATGSDDRTACIVNASTLKTITTIVHPGRVKSVRFSPDDAELLTACRDGVARIWDVRSGALKGSVSHGKRLRFADFSHSGQFIATAGEDNTARIWDARNRRLLVALPHPSWVNHISFSPDDSEVVTSCADHKARVWDISGRQRFPVLGHEDVVMNAEFSPDNRSLVTACLDGTAHLWSRETLQPLDDNAILRIGERVRRVAVSSDGRLIATTGVSGTVRIWDLSGCSTTPSRTACVASLDGNRLMTLSEGGVVVQDAESGKPVGPTIKVEAPIREMQLSSNGRLGAITEQLPGPRGRLFQIFDAGTAQPLGESFTFINLHSKPYLSDDGKLVAIVTSNLVDILDTSSHKVSCPRMTADGDVDGAILDSSEHRMVTWGGKIIQVWNVATGGGCLNRLVLDGVVGGVQLSADGKKFIGCCWDNQLNPYYSQVWNLSNGKPAGPKLMHEDGVLCACFSPDGLHLGSASEDFTAAVWDTSTWQHRFAPVRHHDRVRCIEFNPAGDEIVTCSSDKTARVWSAESGDPLTPPLRHLSEVESAMFLARGRRVLTATSDGSKHIWDLNADDRAIGDLSAIANILCGNAIDSQGSGRANKAESLRTAWQRLRKEYPSTFSVSEAEIRQWHEFAADESESKGEWYSAVFHLKYLLANDPTNAAMEARLAAAAKHLLHQ